MRLSPIIAMLLLATLLLSCHKDCDDPTISQDEEQADTSGTQQKGFELDNIPVENLE